MTQINLKAHIDILARYDPNHESKIVISVYDDLSHQRFLDLEMTPEQFVNAAMNRMAHTEMVSATLFNLERIGKKLETRNFEFELPEHNYNNRLEITRETVKKVVPDGWTPDMSFSSRESFFTRDKKEYARTTLRRWVEPTNEGE
jgi:hypothetical protein